jgi:flagellar hook-associated protein 1 FlgK
MSGFDSAAQSLAAQQFALSISQRNVANANDPNYTRQDVVFTGDVGSSVSGVGGVALQASRDRYLDYSISREMQELGENNVAHNGLQQISSVLGENSGENLQRALTNYFNSFSSLSTAPEDMVLRQQVLSNANTLTGEFKRIYAGIQQVQHAQDRSVAYTVDDINAITAQIADLNKQINIAKGSRSETESLLRDSRQQLLEKLSDLMDVSYYETQSTMVMVTTRDGGLIVNEDQSIDLSAVNLAPDPFLHVQLDGVDITDSLNSGQLGGFIKLRDQTIPGYLSALDDMAAAIIMRVNEQHVQGSDYSGTAGEDFFTPFTQIIPGSNQGCAGSMNVALTNPEKVAAAASGAGLGDNANAKALAAIADETLLSSTGGALATETLNDAYARLVYWIGSETATAQESLATQNSLLERLRNQRDASSGVSLDEEAVNIIKYQKAYQASARYANILDNLSEEILQLLGA